VYQRPRTVDRGFGDNCGKLCAILHWYEGEYEFARQNILFGDIEGKPAVFIDNHLLVHERPEGLFLHHDRLIDHNRGAPIKILSTSKAFHPAPELIASLPPDAWKPGGAPIGARLTADMFFFRRSPVEGPEGHDLLEASIAPAMPSLVTSPHPALDAARYHTQVEFDRTYRSFQGALEYRGKNLLFVAGVNIDVSPPEGLPFPLTKFVPWAAYWRLRDGSSALLEQDDLVAALARQPVANPDQMSFDSAIQAMADAQGVSLPF